MKSHGQWKRTNIEEEETIKEIAVIPYYSTVIALHAHCKERASKLSPAPGKTGLLVVSLEKQVPVTLTLIQLPVGVTHFSSLNLPTF